MWLKDKQGVSNDRVFTWISQSRSISCFGLLSWNESAPHRVRLSVPCINPLIQVYLANPSVLCRSGCTATTAKILLPLWVFCAGCDENVVFTLYAYVTLFPEPSTWSLSRRRPRASNCWVKFRKVQDSGRDVLSPSFSDEPHPVSPCAHTHAGCPPISEAARSGASNVHKDVVMMRSTGVSQ